MGRKSGEADVTITVRVPRGLAEHLRRLSWQSSIFEMRRVSVSQLVRQAIEKAYGDGRADASAEPTVQPQGQ